MSLALLSRFCRG